MPDAYFACDLDHKYMRVITVKYFLAKIQHRYQTETLKLLLSLQIPLRQACIKRKETLKLLLSRRIPLGRLVFI
jgi:hypothetical protein